MTWIQGCIVIFLLGTLVGLQLPPWPGWRRLFRKPTPSRIDPAMARAMARWMRAQARKHEEP